MAALRKAQQKLWQAIHASGNMSASELWSWDYIDGHYVTRPFGQGKSDADESNAVQMWSAVYLAIPSPEAGASGN